MSQFLKQLQIILCITNKQYFILNTLLKCFNQDEMHHEQIHIFLVMHFYLTVVGKFYVSYTNNQHAQMYFGSLISLHKTSSVRLMCAKTIQLLSLSGTNTTPLTLQRV